MQRLGLVTLLVDDYDRALACYVRDMGFELVEDSFVAPGRRWVVVAPPGGRGASLLLAKAEGAHQAPRVGDQTGGRVFLFLYTDDFRGDHARLTAAGLRFVSAPREEPYGWVAVFEDVYGNRWDLLEESGSGHPATD